MRVGPDRLGYDLSGALVVRAAWTASAFLLALASLPNLEDAGPVAFAVWLVNGPAVLLAAFVGAAWAFDAPDIKAARLRAQRAWFWASHGVLLFCAALLSQTSLAPPDARRLAYFLAPAMAFLGYFDFPWDWLAGAAKRLRGPAPGPERYDAAVGAPATERAPTKHLSPGVEALLVGAGAFKVDRKRMIKVLSGFQTGDPEGFLLPWQRLAVASGASRIELVSRETGLEVHFDGRPLAPAHCADPFLSMVGEEDSSGDAERHRHLAWGLLNALPLAPRVVVGRSGGSRILVEPKGAAKTHWADPEPRLGTVLRVVFDGWDADLKAARCLERARDAWGLAEASLTVDGEAVAGWEPRPGVGTRFAAGAARGVFYREEDAGSFYEPRLYWLGAFVCADSPTTMPQGWACRLTYDGLVPSASLFSVQWNDAFKAAGKAARDEFDRLAEAGALGPGVLRAPAYTKAGLASALAGAVLSFAAFVGAQSARPDLAWAAAGVYGASTAVVLWLVARWALARLRGRLNPFRS